MRDNTAAIIASPEFSTRPHGTGNLAFLRFNSVMAAHSFAIKHARTDNEKSWINSTSFLGSNKQTMADIDATGKATYPLECVKKAIANLDQIPNKPGSIRNTVTGGSWDIPSVLAGLPLAARSRVRNSLPPLTLQIMIDFSSNVTAEFMAPITAKIARALNDYTLNGGVVNLTICSIAQTRNEDYKLIIVETKVNAADIANIAFAFSPVFIRGIMYPIEAAVSLRNRDVLPIVYEKPIPSAYYLTGSLEDIEESSDKVLAALKIS